MRTINRDAGLGLWTPTGAPVVNSLGSDDTGDSKNQLRLHQENRIAMRFGISRPTARLIVELAFADGGTR